MGGSATRYNSNYKRLIRAIRVSKAFQKPLKAHLGPLGPRALRVLVLGLTWWRGLCPLHTPPGDGASGAIAGALFTQSESRAKANEKIIRMGGWPKAAPPMVIMV